MSLDNCPECGGSGVKRRTVPGLENLGEMPLSCGACLGTGFKREPGKGLVAQVGHGILARADKTDPLAPIPAEPSYLEPNDGKS